MSGWKLTFKFSRPGMVIDLEYVGSQQAIRTGIGLTALAVGEQLTRRLGAGQLPEGLGEEALMLSAIHGGAPMTAYEGKFLCIEPVTQVTGLSTSVHVEWGD